jgi:hypothetical protein
VLAMNLAVKTDAMKVNVLAGDSSQVRSGGS